MKLITAALLIFLALPINAADGDHCVVGTYAVIDRSLAACQRDVETGVARFMTDVSATRMGLFLEDNLKNEKINNLFYKARNISVRDFIRMLNAGPLAGKYTFQITVPTDSPERLQALKDFVSEYNRLQDLSGMVPQAENKGANLPPIPPAVTRTAE